MFGKWLILGLAVLSVITAPAVAADFPPQGGSEPPLFVVPPDDAMPSGERAVTVYGGFYSTNNFTRLLFTPWDSEVRSDIPWLGVSMSQRVGTLGDHVSFDLEAGTGYRFGSEKTGEFWTALFVRYDDFPWSHHVYTTMAVSTGLNLATRISPQERIKSGGGGSELLHYFAPEITIADPDNKNLELALRLHHRSGVFGLFDGVSSGSNIVTLGIRQRF